MNGTVTKNQLIFDFASGVLGPSKSLFASTYLFLNTKATELNNTFENMLGDTLFDNENTPVSKLTYKDCITKDAPISTKNQKEVTHSPISRLVGPFDKIVWKQVYKGFSEFVPNLSHKDDDELKLIKMDPGASVPLHSHGGKEFILVLDGSFQDENGTYSKGDIQINDQKIKHTPMASKEHGCICLTITEKDVIFFGKFGSFLNLFTFVKSFFK